jgi:hypothetical protein
MAGITDLFQNRRIGPVWSAGLVVFAVLGAPLLASCSSSSSAVLSNEQSAYVARFLSGSGNYTRIVFHDRTMRATPTSFYYSPTIAADRMLAEYVRSRVREDVSVEIARDVPPAIDIATYPPGSSPPARLYHNGIVYIEIIAQRWRHLDGTQISEVIPAVHVYGNAAVIKGPILLTEPAPGDVPCQSYCRSAQQTFDAVRGRIDLILRNVAK